LDVDHKVELQRGGALLGYPDAASETPKQFDQQIVNSADSPLFAIPKPNHASLPDPALSKAIQTCLDQKGRRNTPQ
jgi:hypothetical protein